MLSHLFFSAWSQIQINGWCLRSQILVLQISLRQRSAKCPNCKMLSEKIHSRYVRTLSDLPCAGLAVKIHFSVRRFFCTNPYCHRVTFTEQFSNLTPRYARRTTRLLEKQHRVGYELGGEPGKRILNLFEVPISGDRLLSFIREGSEKAIPETRILGVDDWAFRRGQVYGTILVDLERSRTIDLLPDRETATLANWLHQHPEVMVVSRDRSQAYIEGIRQGAPQAIQVADRFHLLQNLLDALKRMIERRPKELREAERQIALVLSRRGIEDPPSKPATREENDQFSQGGAQTKVIDSGENQPSFRKLRFAEVKQLQQQGLSQREIARRLGLARRTIQRYFSLDQFPARSQAPQSTSKATPYMPYLKKRWDEGCRTGTLLFQEIRSQGFKGSYAGLWRMVTKFPKNPVVGSSIQPRDGWHRWSPNQAAWLLLSKPEALSAKQAIAREVLCQISLTAEIAYPLVQKFTEMVREQQAEKLGEWMDQAENSGIQELKRFSKGLRNDFAAVKAALEYPWSNGPVEGQVNRLKLIKREMYGRAKFDLLRRRVLGVSVPP
jgi:transposase